MKSRNIKLSISLALAAVFGAANSAGAVTFAPGSSITFVQTVYQINAAGSDDFYPDLPTGEFNGGANDLFDLLAGVATISADDTIDSDNRVLNYPISAGGILELGDEPIGYFDETVDVTADAKGDNAAPGSATLGLALIGANNMGIPFSSKAYTNSADGVLNPDLNETNGGQDEVLINVYDDFGGSETHKFTLDEITSFCYNPQGGGGFKFGFQPPLDDTCAEGIFAFQGNGKVIADGMETEGVWDFNGTGFFDDGTGGDAVANDGVTRLTGNDLTFTVTPTPEPSTLLGLASVLGLGAFAKRKKQR